MQSTQGDSRKKKLHVKFEVQETVKGTNYKKRNKNTEEQLQEIWRLLPKTQSEKKLSRLIA